MRETDSRDEGGRAEGGEAGEAGGRKRAQGGRTHEATARAARGRTRARSPSPAGGARPRAAAPSPGPRGRRGRSRERPGLRLRPRGGRGAPPSGGSTAGGGPAAVTLKKPQAGLGLRRRLLRHRAAPGPGRAVGANRRLAWASSWGRGQLSSLGCPAIRWQVPSSKAPQSSLQPQGSNSLAHSRYRTDSAPRTDLSASLAQRYPVPEVGRREHGDTCLAHFPDTL